MPIHDWTRVDAGVFHDFHNAWITEIRNVLNDGLLPPDYYALAEQLAGKTGPDVLTLHTDEDFAGGPVAGSGATAVRSAPPQVRTKVSAQIDWYVSRQKTLVIRHSSGHRIVALVELMSCGNKAGQREFRKFLAKAVSALSNGYHLLIVDLFPPSRRDPQGIHGAIWAELVDDDYQPPPGLPLTLVAYVAGIPIDAYIEPIAVGQALPNMPLFLNQEAYVSVPLETTYLRAYRGVPRYYREILEAG